MSAKSEAMPKAKAELSARAKALKEMPIEKRVSIDIRNDHADHLCELEVEIEKADFLLEIIQSDYTCELPTAEVMQRWAYERGRISQLIDMSRDYVRKVQKLIETMASENKEKTKADWGGAIEDV